MCPQDVTELYKDQLQRQESRLGSLRKQLVAEGILLSPQEKEAALECYQAASSLHVYRGLLCCSEGYGRHGKSAKPAFGGGGLCETTADVARLACRLDASCRLHGRPLASVEQKKSWLEDIRRDCLQQLQQRVPGPCTWPELLQVATRVSSTVFCEAQDKALGKCPLSIPLESAFENLIESAQTWHSSPNG